MSKEHLETVEETIKFKHNFKSVFTIVLTVIFLFAWIYVKLLGHIEIGKAVAVFGFAITFFIAYQFRKEENRRNPYFGLFVGNVILLMMLTATIRQNL